MKDCIIIGGGPAGVSAAINLKLNNKDFIWICGKSPSKKVSSAEHIKNYPGLPDVTGKQLAWALDNHASLMDIQKNEDIATAIYDLGGTYAVTAGENTYESKTIILCLGVTASKPIDGEERLLGKGVSYCATCDGFLYKGKTIAVMLTDKAFEAEAEFLCSLAKKVYLFPIYKDCKITAENAEIIVKVPQKIEGEKRVERIICGNESIDAEGIFILRSSVSPSVLLKGLAAEDGHITVDRQMRTNLKGVFAAGDCTGRPYQYAKSVGEGNVAAHSVIDYLAELKNN
ncbi:MAG: NAD(P)/FAD-dependent oxidoreductase [Clostridia bacterium]|nr:NAD(P)/FAD-dependent oxidoreductase [Clostridia bacterium]